MSESENTIGQSTALSSVEEWAELPLEITFQQVEQPWFVEYVSPQNGTTIFDKALDRQRLLEHRMRDIRSEARAQQIAGNEEDYAALKVRYKLEYAEYTRFSEAMSIQPQWERVYMDSLGHILFNRGIL